jgi:hypothetical protein
LSDVGEVISELEIELIQTHMAQKPMLRVEVPTQPGNQRLEMMAGQKKEEKELREGGGGSRSSPARVQKPKTDIETQSGELYFRPLLLGVSCECSGRKDPVVAR